MIDFWDDIEFGKNKLPLIIIFFNHGVKGDLSNAKPLFLGRGEKRRSLRQAQDTEFIEVQHQP